MTLCHLTPEMKSDLHAKLLKVRDHVNMILHSINEEEGCLLCEISGIKELAYDVETLATFYHFQSSLLPNVIGMDDISRGLAALAEKHHGALIAIEQKDEIEPFIVTYSSNSTLIDAQVSAPLLQAIFFPGNPLHDGAVTIRNGKIISAGCVLPLSNQKYNLEGSKLGTRHRAALGLSERTDAIVLVVSEESGQVSFASNGKLHAIEVQLCEGANRAAQDPVLPSLSS
ncbi:MAG TPA: diadenylate cyclase [Bacillota bacterium]|nr:diadenylate cyclase [Bacillota bacterium]